MSDDVRKRERSILTFFATSLAARGVGIGCQLLQVPIALKHLGNEAFGLWVTLFSFGFMLAYADFGIGLGVQNKISEVLGKDQKDEARRIFVTGLVFLSGIMLALLALLVPFCLWADLSAILRISDPYVTKSVSQAILVVCLVWCANIPLGLGQRLAYGAQLGWTHNVTTTISQALLLAAVAAGAWLKVGMTGFFILTFVSGGVVNLIFLIYLLRRLGWLKIDFRQFQPAYLREISKLGIFFFLQQVAMMVLFTAPPLILSATVGAAAVTPFNLTQRVLNLFMVVTNAVLLPLWPAYAEAKAKDDWPWIRRTLFRSISMVMLLAVLPMICVGPFIPLLIKWWTGANAHPPAQSLVWLLVAWNALTALQQPFGFLLAGLSKIQRATIYSLLSTVAVLAVIFFLAPRMGVNAVPIGLIIGFLPFIFCGTVLETILILRAAPRVSPASEIPPPSASAETPGTGSPNLPPSDKSFRIASSNPVVKEA